MAEVHPSSSSPTSPLALEVDIGGCRAPTHLHHPDWTQKQLQQQPGRATGTLARSSVPAISNAAPSGSPRRGGTLAAPSVPHPCMGLFSGGVASPSTSYGRLVAASSCSSPAAPPGGKGGSPAPAPSPIHPAACPPASAAAAATPSARTGNDQPELRERPQSQSQPLQPEQQQEQEEGEQIFWPPVVTAGPRAAETSPPCTQARPPLAASPAHPCTAQAPTHSGSNSFVPPRSTTSSGSHACMPPAPRLEPRPVEPASPPASSWGPTTSLASHPAATTHRTAAAAAPVPQVSQQQHPYAAHKLSPCGSPPTLCAAIGSPAQPGIQDRRLQTHQHIDAAPAALPAGCKAVQRHADAAALISGVRKQSDGNGSSNSSGDNSGTPALEAERSVPVRCAAAAATARCEVAPTPARATVTLDYLQTFLRDRVLPLSNGAPWTTRQVVERLVQPVCAAHGCRYPEAPAVAPQLLPSGCTQQQQQQQYHQPTPQHYQLQAAAQPEGDSGPFRSTSPDWPLSPQPPWGLSALSSPPGSCSHSHSCSAPWGSASEVSSSVPGRSSTTHMSTCASANLGSASVCGSEAWTRSNVASSSGNCSIAASRSASGAAPSNSAPVASTAPTAPATQQPSPQAVAAATAAAGALPAGQLTYSSLPYLYVVHAWDCCFAELVALLSAQMAGVPACEVRLWIDIFSADQSAAQVPSLVQRQPTQPSPTPTQCAMAEARHALAHASAVLLCLLPEPEAQQVYQQQQQQDLLYQSHGCSHQGHRPCGPVPPALRRTWCLWELATAVRLRGPGVVKVLHGPRGHQGQQASAEAETISPGVALSVTFARATCSRPQDAAALLSDYRAPLVHDSPNTALYGPSYDRAADDVAAVDAALQLLLLLQPVGFEGELQELHQRALSCPTGGPWGVGMASGAGADEDEGEVKGVAASAPAASPWRLQALRSRLLDPAGPPCVIVSGAPGCGKSTLAAALWAHQHQRHGAEPTTGLPPAPRAGSDRCTSSRTGPSANGTSTSSATPSASSSAAEARGEQLHVHAVHACSHVDVRRQDPVAVLRSLSYQLALRLPAFRDALLDELQCGAYGTAACSGNCYRESGASPFASSFTLRKSSASSSYFVDRGGCGAGDVALEEAAETLLLRPLRAAAAVAAISPQQGSPCVRSSSTVASAEGHTAPIVLLIDGVDEPGPGLAADGNGCSRRGGSGRSGSDLQRPLTRHPATGTHSAWPQSGCTSSGGSGGGAFPLARLGALLLPRLPSGVRLLLTASTVPVPKPQLQPQAPAIRRCGSIGPAPADRGPSALSTTAACHPAATALTPAPYILPPSALSSWLGCEKPCPVTGPLAAAARPVAPPPPAIPEAAVLPLAYLRDELTMTTALYGQLVLRVGPGAASRLLGLMLWYGGDQLSYYAKCMLVQGLSLQRLPTSLESVLYLLFQQTWGGLSKSDRDAAQRLLSVLAAAREPVPLGMLHSMGLATALPLLPAWGHVFVQQGDGTVAIRSSAAARWVRQPDARAAAAGFGADLLLGHALLAAHLQGELHGAGARRKYDTASASYGRRHLGPHLASTAALMEEEEAAAAAAAAASRTDAPVARAATVHPAASPFATGNVAGATAADAGASKSGMIAAGARLKRWGSAKAPAGGQPAGSESRLRRGLANLFRSGSSSSSGRGREKSSTGNCSSSGSSLHHSASGSERGLAAAASVPAAASAGGAVLGTAKLGAASAADGCACAAGGTSGGNECNSDTIASGSNCHAGSGGGGRGCNADSRRGMPGLDQVRRWMAEM